ncbi:MAG: SPOR domain-containing protein [Emergencia sp.]|uniref:SPOR domain-containing protein n=1 Tax=Anaerotruncus TaxID=244127 RepID=UPI001362B165|nr:SPOR domain-containing protein [Emergencia sp.]
MNKRKIRRYHRQRKNSGVNLLGIVGIMLVAVVCGYMTARFIIAPLLGYDTEVLKLDFPSNLLDVFHSDDEKDGSDDGSDEGEEQKDKNDAEKTDAEGEYTLQYGVFSSKSGAEELAGKLKTEDIDTEIMESDGQFKVISSERGTKKEALALLKDTESSYAKGIFITQLS